MATVANSAERKEHAPQKEKRIDLTPTGLLMEGLYTKNPWGSLREGF